MSLIHKVSHRLEIAISGGGDHQAQCIGKSKMRHHRGIFPGFQDLGFGKAFENTDIFIDKAVYLATSLGSCSVDTPNPLRPGFYRFALPLPQIHSAWCINEMVTFTSATGLEVIKRMQAEMIQSMLGNNLFSGSGFNELLITPQIIFTALF